MTSAKLKIEYLPVAGLVPYARNARTHSPEQVSQLAASIREFGFTNPVLVDPEGGIVAGHGRVLAAIEVGLAQVPALRLGWLTEAQRRAYVLADNRLAELAGWNHELLREELSALADAGVDVDLLGFVDFDFKPAQIPPGVFGPETPPKIRPHAVSKRGDVWLLGDHRLMCGSCTDEADVAKLLRGERADICITDPPYGLGGRKESGKNDYSEYIDSRENLIELAKAWLPIARRECASVVFSPGVTNQWLYPEPSWVLCWFYGGGQLRSSWGFNCWQPFLFYGDESWGVSAWEPILAYGKDPSLAAGCGGRPDAINLNVPANAADIDHPCPKPVALIEWLINRLIFKENALIYEPFSGSATTIVAATKFGHRVSGMELTPNYVDVGVRRWQAFTGNDAVRESDGKTFNEAAA